MVCPFLPLNNWAPDAYATTAKAIWLQINCRDGFMTWVQMLQFLHTLWYTDSTPQEKVKHWNVKNVQKSLWVQIKYFNLKEHEYLKFWTLIKLTVNAQVASHYSFFYSKM